MERYIVFIANIKPHNVTKKPSDITVNCFLFKINDREQLPVIQGCFNTVSGESPFRLNEDVMHIVRIEAESLTGGKKSKEEQVSQLSEESVGRKKGTETAPLPQEDEGNAEENSMPIWSTQNTDDKAVSVRNKNTPDVAAGTGGLKDIGTVYNSKMGGTKNNSKVRKSNKSSNSITISSKDNKVRSILVDKKTRTSTKTEIPTANDNNHNSSNNGKDSKKSQENKNDKKINTSTNVTCTCTYVNPAFNVTQPPATLSPEKRPPTSPPTS